MKKENAAAEEKIKKNYEKPLLTKHQKLTSIMAQNGSPANELGCTRF